MSTTIQALIGQIAARTGYSTEEVARVAWASITTPGDPRIGHVVDVMGAEEALDFALNSKLDVAGGLNIRALREQVEQLTYRYGIEKPLDLTRDHHLTLLTPAHPAWPRMVDQLGAAAPLVLWAAGDAAALRRPLVAVTGPVEPSPFGIHAAVDLGTGLPGRGWQLATGDRLGTEMLAVQGAVRMGGTTVVLTPRGLHAPRKQAAGSLLARILERGAAISERPPEEPFALLSARERAAQLLAALADKTVIAEAVPGDPAVVTAETAAQLHRPVGVAASPAAPEEALEGYGYLTGTLGAAPIRSAQEVDWL